MVQRGPAIPRHAPSSMVSKEDEGPQVPELLRISGRTRAEDETTREVLLRGQGAWATVQVTCPPSRSCSPPLRQTGGCLPI